MAAAEEPAAAPQQGQDWEASKENFQPLKAGRKAAGLVLRDSTAELRTQAIEAKRREFWEELAAYQGDDPLEVWLRFIKWTQEAFSAGGHKAELLPLLERCTRELQAGGRYADDVRYLRVWVQYADCLPDPADVFAFLRQHEIGQGHALLYVAHATYLEAHGGYAKADAVYQQGINRLAAPLDRLRAKYAEFQQRMARRIQRKAAEQAAGVSEERDHPERQSLGVLGGRRPNPGARVGAGGGLLGGAAGFKRKAAPSAAAGGDQENAPGGGGGSGLAIFMDDEFSGQGAAAAAAAPAFGAAGRPAGGAAASWTKLAGFEAGRKENVQRAAPWAGQRLKQAGAAAPPTAPALEIFVDPELQEAEDAAADADAGHKPTLRQRLDCGGGAAGAAAGGDPEEALLADPLRLHKAQAYGQLQGGVAPDAKRRREEALAFDARLLQGGGGEEQCFEEVRAQAWLARKAAQAAAAAESDDMELEGQTCALPPLATAALVVGPRAPTPTAASAVRMRSPQQQQQSEQALASPAAASATAEVDGVAAAFGSPVAPEEEQAPQQTADAEEAAEPQPEASADPEPEQPAAAAAGAAMPGPAEEAEPVAAPQPAAAEGPASPAADAGAPYEPTMTISTHDAFAAINQMFGGSLPAGGDPADAMAGAAAAAAEPTMTIATADAFAALNQMFKGALPLEHGCLPPNPHSEPTLQLGGRGGGGGAGPSFDPTMTISTKAAFDAINQMFKGSLATEHGCLPPTARGPSYEPTMTISTKAAFDAINQMFGGGGLAAPSAAAPAPGPASQAGDGGFRVPAPRPPRARAPAAATVQAPAASPGDFCIREDTQFVSVPCGGASALDSPAGSDASPLGGGFGIREDTQFVTVPADDRDEHDGGAPGGGGFCVHEDTQYITVPMAAAAEEEEEGGCGDDAAQQPAAAQAPGGFCIREDTQFFGGASPGLSPASSGGMGHGGGSSGSLLPCKRPLSDCDGSSADLLGGGRNASVSPALGRARVQGTSKWGFAPGADDTLALMLGDGDTQALLDEAGASLAAAPAALAAAEAYQPAGRGASNDDGTDDSGALQAGLAGLQLGDCKENLVQPGAEGSHGACPARRSLADPAVASGALQPLGAARAEGLGLAMHADAASEAALAAAGGKEDPAGDEFEVWADDSTGSPPLMGSPRLQQPGSMAGREEDFLTPVQTAPGEGEGPPLLDPFSASFHSRMLACLEPGVQEWPGVYCMSEEEEAAAEAGLASAARAKAAGLEELQLCGLEFAVSGCIGEGGYARVFQGVDGDCADVALKHEGPPCPWEWYICKALAGRLPAAAAARRRFIDPSALLLGARCSLLVAPLGPHGTLQDLVNACLAQGQPPSEPLAMHVAVELLRMLRDLHSARILHCDIKPDNLLVTLEEEAAEPGDENVCGPRLGLQLIDWGRGVDLELLPPGALLQGDSGTDAFRCVQQREGTPWLWQADAYGVAATAHVALQGRYLEVERVRGVGSGEVCLRPCLPLKRQWEGELWGAFFHRLLNHEDPAAPPAVDDLIAGFEGHLSGSREAARRLRRDLSAAAALLPRRC